MCIILCNWTSLKRLSGEWVWKQVLREVHWYTAWNFHFLYRFFFYLHFVWLSGLFLSIYTSSLGHTCRQLYKLHYLVRTELGWGVWGSWVYWPNPKPILIYLYIKTWNVDFVIQLWHIFSDKLVNCKIINLLFLVK